MKRKIGIIAGFLLVASATAVYAYFDEWLLWNEDAVIEIEHNAGYQQLGPLTNLKVHRGALSGGTHTLRFVLTIQAVGVLTSAYLQTANDTNVNGVLDPNEWTTRAAASISESGGVTTAVTQNVTVSNALDGYRVIYDRSDLDATIAESWLSEDVE